MSSTYLAPIEHPKSLRLKLAYAAIRRQFGKVPESFVVGKSVPEAAMWPLLCVGSFEPTNLEDEHA